MPLTEHVALAGSPQPAACARRVEAEQVALLYSQGIASQLVTVVNVGLVALVLWQVADRTTLLLWVTLMVVIAAARALIVLAYRRAAPTIDEITRWRARFVACTLASGIGWGTAGVALFPQVPLVYQVFLAYVLGGMAVGAAAVMAPVLLAYWAFLAPTTAPIIVQLFLRGDAMSVSMGIMFTACTLMFLNSAKQMGASIAESIRLRFENVDLVQSLSAAKDAAEAANRSLEVEVGERTRAERELTVSLREKDVLLTEIHHRVKNNLQVISSLLSLQARSIGSDEARSVFTESQNRVRSMALVHEKLYQSRDLARIDFSAYVRELVSHLFHVYRTEELSLRIRVESVFLTIERAVPCGLIVSELVSNALKYAFPEKGKGEIAIELAVDEAGRCTLTVRDDGVGLPADFDLRHPTSLGLRIVNTLTEQLGGALTVRTDGGTAFNVAFPIEDEDEDGPGEQRAHSHPGC